MTRGKSWPWSWSLMLSLLLSLFAHGELSLATASRTEVKHSQSSFSAAERAVLSGDDSAELIGLGLGLGAGLPLSVTKRDHSHRRHSHLDFAEEDIQPIREELTGGESPERSDDIIKVEFHNTDRPLPPDRLSDSFWLMAVAQPLQQRAGDPTAWTLSDFYDYMSPDDNISAIEMTLDPEPTLNPPADIEDENPSLTGTTVTPGNDDPQPPSQSQPPPPPSPSQGSDGCGLGFVRSEVGGECVSQCDAQPDFCYNRGVCAIDTGIGAFCRCNAQDYMWNKGSRCDWVVTVFQVLCVVVGVASLTLILLIIIIVFFAKRLHRFRIENRRLRKRSLYRPQSEMQTDGFSVSMAPDSSHANGGVTIGLQLLLPKEAKLRPEASPPLHYNVFLYKKGTGPSTTINTTATNYTNHKMAAARNHSNRNILPTSNSNKSNPNINHNTNKHSQLSQNHVPPHRHPHTSPSSHHSSPCFTPPQRTLASSHHASPHHPPYQPSPNHHSSAFPPSPPPPLQRHTSPPGPSTSLPLLTHSLPSHLPPAKYNPISTYSLC
ncbi:uncharacterized protein LOC121572643 [Coregonus clupeaformis]|uniref:uncharacterized protein LOC121572643 n=1 Tax=Coregonus clupeaformis TaxID=59861 RepID=UPI001E1C7138|nr:uncharacterized protein LOC121572643 [Coregonus clupeaformis]